MTDHKPVMTTREICDWTESSNFRLSDFDVKWIRQDTVLDAIKERKKIIALVTAENDESENPNPKISEVSDMRLHRKVQGCTYQKIPSRNLWKS